MTAKITDVAALANVSITTVSHVINNTRFVSAIKRERVLKAMETLDYHPSELARGLRQGVTKTIGLIVPDSLNPFFAEILRCIEDIGFKEGYSVILCNSDGDIEKEIAYTRVLMAKHVDGIIFIAANETSEHLLEVTDKRPPIVIVDRDFQLPGSDVILVDNFQGGYDATRYLLQLGHRKIACVTGPEYVTPSRDRVRGYRQAMEDSGVAVNNDYIITGDFRYQGGIDAMAKVLEVDPRPTAVFICNDMMALGALKKLRVEKIPAPENMSIIGFDDILLSSLVTPELTTVAQPVQQLATSSIQLLLSRIRKEDTAQEPQKIILPASLIVRESCAPVRDE